MFKKISLLILFLQLVFTNAVFTQNQNSSSEEEAIKQIIMKETKSWEQRDYKGMADVWLHEEYVISMYSNPYSSGEHIGWDSVNASMERNIEEYKDPFKIDLNWSDWNIRIFNDCAWVSYIQTSIYEEDKGKPYESREIRFLEKKNGLWKFVFLNTLSKTGFQDYLSRDAEYRLNDVGYNLLEENKNSEAIKVFKLNVELYPESSNVYDSLGEAYMKNGDKELSIKNYEMSLKLDPSNEYAKEMIMKMKEH